MKVFLPFHNIPSNIEPLYTRGAAASKKEKVNTSNLQIQLENRLTDERCVEQELDPKNDNHTIFLMSMTIVVRYNKLKMFRI